VTAQASHHHFVLLNLAPNVAFTPGNGDLEPVDIFHTAAGLANEVVMLLGVPFEPDGMAVHQNFADEAGCRHGVQALVNRRD